MGCQQHGEDVALTTPPEGDGLETGDLERPERSVTHAFPDRHDGHARARPGTPADVMPTGRGSDSSWYDVPVGEDEVVTRLRAAGCVFAEEEAALLVAEVGGGSRLEGLVARRVAGEPLEHLLGWAEFLGRRMVVAPQVFVPRRRTELLAREAVAAARARGAAPVVVELCCGVAAVAAVVADEVPGATVLAVDDDAAAVACAAGQPGRRWHRPRSVTWTPRCRRPCAVAVDVLVANPPHVPTDEIALMPPEARDHEARTALDGGPDGTTVLHRILDLAGTWLAPGGVLLLEAGRDQAAALAAALTREPRAPGPRRYVEVRTDDEVQGTVVVVAARPH